MWAMDLAYRFGRVDVYAMLAELHGDELEMWSAYFELRSEATSNMQTPEEFLGGVQSNYADVH